MKNVGWIKLHRKMLDWSLCDTPSAFNLYCHLLLMASYEEATIKGVSLERGQLFTTIKKLEVITGMSTKAIRNALLMLEDEECIECIGANKGTKITICNFDSYQSDEEVKGQTKGTTKGTTKGQTQGQTKGTTKGQTAIYNVYKEDKEIEEYKENQENQEEREDFARTHEVQFNDINLADPKVVNGEVVTIIDDNTQLILKTFQEFWEQDLNRGCYASRNDDFHNARELYEKIKVLREQTAPNGRGASEYIFVKNFFKVAYNCDEFYRTKSWSLKIINQQFNDIINKVKNGKARPKTKEEQQQANKEWLLNEYRKQGYDVSKWEDIFGSDDNA